MNRINITLLAVWTDKKHDKEKTEKENKKRKKGNIFHL